MSLSSVLAHSRAPCQSYSVFQPASLLYVGVTPQCYSIMLCSVSELLPSVPAHFCVFCQGYSTLFQHTALFSVRVAVHCSSTVLCSVSELLPIVAAHFCVLCKIYSVVFQHTALSCIRYMLTIHHKV